MGHKGREHHNASEGAWMVVAVTKEGPGNLAGRTACFVLDGNEMGGVDAKYESLCLLGTTDDNSPTLEQMPGLGISRVYFLMTNVFLCEASTVAEYVRDACANVMALGFCLMARDGEHALVAASPLVICEEPRNKKKGKTWKRMKTLWIIIEFECLVVYVILIVTQFAARGWYRFNLTDGNGMFITQGPGMTYDTPSWERRFEVVGEEAFKAVTNLRILFQRAAIVGRAPVAECLYATAQLVGRLRRICESTGSTAVACRTTMLSEQTPTTAELLRRNFFVASAIFVRARRLFSRYVDDILQEGGG